MEAFARDLVAKAHLQLESPLAMPVLASLGALLFSMVALYACAVVGRRKAVEAGGSMLNEQGLRRSTRAHKPPADRFSPSKQLVGSPTVAKTPKAQKTPRALKKAEAEAVTVTPRAAKPRSRAAKTPATAEPMTARTRRGAAKTPAH